MKKRLGVLLLVGTAMIVGCGQRRDRADRVTFGKGMCTKHDPQEEPFSTAKTMSDEEAVAIAERAASRHMDLADTLPPTVRRSDGHAVVTFKLPRAPGVRQADYAAEVIINARSGEVVRVLVGS